MVKDAPDTLHTALGFKKAGDGKRETSMATCSSPLLKGDGGWRISTSRRSRIPHRFTSHHKLTSKPHETVAIAGGRRPLRKSPGYHCESNPKTDEIKYLAIDLGGTKVMAAVLMRGPLISVRAPKTRAWRETGSFTTIGNGASSYRRRGNPRQGLARWHGAPGHRDR